MKALMSKVCFLAYFSTSRYIQWYPTKNDDLDLLLYKVRIILEFRMSLVLLQLGGLDWIDWIEQCFTSSPTQYRLYGRQFLQVVWGSAVSSHGMVRNRIWWILGLKIWHLVATISVVFPLRQLLYKVCIFGHARFLQFKEGAWPNGN